MAAQILVESRRPTLGRADDKKVWFDNQRVVLLGRRLVAGHQYLVLSGPTFYAADPRTPLPPPDEGSSSHPLVGICLMSCLPASTVPAHRSAFAVRMPG